ncbi:T9SS type A sorting domain-containing protein [Lentimicrobium sp. L6]|nr:T9SS type A sorting domain-containing protein [Lentimicrobium sp. L6]NPD83256.1 T9SS type A sorting domain-containing protein [Lentimicrobium sp. L6]
MKKFYGIFIMLLVVQLGFAQKVTVPQLTSPENEFETAMPDAVLDWVAVSGVGEITYHVQLATDASFTNLVVDENQNEISAYYNSNLLFGQEYFWRVKATDNNGTSEWSDTFTFSVFTEVELSKPNDGKDGIDILAELKWKNRSNGETIVGVGGFDIDIDTVNTFDSPYHSMINAEGVVFEQITDYLLFGKVHYWRVRAMHADGFSPWSEIREFETVPTVELDKPSNNTTDEEFDLTLKWDKLGDEGDDFEYTLEVSTDEVFTEPVTIITLNDEAEPDFLKFGHEYWWRVKATTPTSTSPWSEVYKFTMIASPELTSPENNQEVNTLRPKLEWETIEGAAGYEIVLSENADLSDGMMYTVDNNTGSYPLPVLDRNTSYYWSVKATRENDDSEYAETFMFNIINVGVEELTNISEVSLFPNPATTSMALSFIAKQSGNLDIVISDILGKTVSNQSVDVKTGLFNENINIEDLNQGIYFLELNQNNESKVIRFLVK